MYKLTRRTHRCVHGVTIRGATVDRQLLTCLSCASFGDSQSLERFAIFHGSEYISQSRFLCVRLSCDHGWIPGGSVKVRKSVNQSINQSINQSTHSYPRSPIGRVFSSRATLSACSKLKYIISVPENEYRRGKIYPPRKKLCSGGLCLLSYVGSFSSEL